MLGVITQYESNLLLFVSDVLSVVFYRRPTVKPTVMRTEIRQFIFIFDLIPNNCQVGFTMWQTLDLGDTFLTFCGLIGTAGVVSYILTIVHIFLAPA